MPDELNGIYCIYSPFSSLKESSGSAFLHVFGSEIAHGMVCFMALLVSVVPGPDVGDSFQNAHGQRVLQHTRPD